MNAAVLSSSDSRAAIQTRITQRSFQLSYRFAALTGLLHSYTGNWSHKATQNYNQNMHHEGSECLYIIDHDIVSQLTILTEGPIITG